MKKLLLLIIPLLFACNSNKEKKSFLGIWKETKHEDMGEIQEWIMNNEYTLYSDGSYTLYTILEDTRRDTDIRGLITGTWEEKNDQICFSENDGEEGFSGHSWCYDYIWISANQWEYKNGKEIGILTRK